MLYNFNVCNINIKAHEMFTASDYDLSLVLTKAVSENNRPAPNMTISEHSI